MMGLVVHFCVGLLSSGVPCSDFSGLAGVVSAKGFDFFPEWAARQRLKEVREGWMGLEVRLRHDQVISRGLERDKIQVELLGRGPNADSHFSLTPRNRSGHFNM